MMNALTLNGLAVRKQNARMHFYLAVGINYYFPQILFSDTDAVYFTTEFTFLLNSVFPTKVTESIYVF